MTLLPPVWPFGRCLGLAKTVICETRTIVLVECLNDMVGYKVCSKTPTL